MRDPHEPSEDGIEIPNPPSPPENTIPSGDIIATEKGEEISEIGEEISENEGLIKSCCVCLTEENLSLCQKCRIVYFCSEVHEEIHRPHDKCFPFIVRSSPKTGR